ncbi:MAG: hypothetical protein AAF430_19920 [Myxococcota bacterium]
MITGANTNVRYRGIQFHVQTEDSGRSNPHIISHLYHGGTILGSQKTDYSEHLDSDELILVVRGLIDQQHVAMVEKLQAGGFDDVIAERLGETAAEAGFAAPSEVSKPDTEPELDGPLPPPQQTEADTEVDHAERPQAGFGSAEPQRGFGEGIMGAEKPLDEVILDYLAEKARARGPERDSAAARKIRSGG